MIVEDKSDRIEKIFKRVAHPEVAHALFDLGMIKDIDIKDAKVAVTLKVPMLDIPIKDYLIKDIESAVKRENENVEIEIDIKEMDAEERAKFMKMAQDAWRG